MGGVMTDEQILQLAENHLTLEKWEDICWKADTLQLLKFARELCDNAKWEGYYEGYEVCSIDMGGENLV
jgi:hypothetical protein